MLDGAAEIEVLEIGTEGIEEENISGDGGMFVETTAP
jgi:hypothetical protein